MKNNRKGSVSVFLVFIMAAVIGAAAAFVYAAKCKAYTGISDGALNLAMRSVLSEYDLTLYERYGLLAFEKNGQESALEIADYVDYAFTSDTPVKKVRVTLGDYSMADVNILKRQIMDHMKTSAAENLLNTDRSNVERKDWQDRTLRNQGLIHELPSAPFADDGAGFLASVEQFKEQINDVDNIFSETAGSYFLDTYILDHFKYATGGDMEEASFFQHEVEYILAGSYSNERNREKVESAIKILRIALNTAYLYSDPDKKALTLAAAEALTPGAGAATQAVIITTWATAEASNDVKLLLKGKPVPFMKTDESWATDLESVLENAEGDCIDPGIADGLFYDDYMMVFLHFQNENVKLARVADLIQINMKATQDRGFLMKTSSSGMHLGTEIYGKEMTYETCY